MRDEKAVDRPDEQPEYWREDYPEGRKTPMGESFGIITPNREMFVANHQAPTPNINARPHTLLIHGPGGAAPHPHMLRTV